jgi:hypothetical protein
MNGVSPLLDLKILLLTMPTILGMIFEAALRKIRMKSIDPDKVQYTEIKREEPVGNA